MTGLGSVEPELPDGTVVTASGRVRTNVSVRLFQSEAEVLYAGPAPGLLAGVYQVNIRVPVTPVEDWVPVSVDAGRALAQSGAGLFVSCAVTFCGRWQ
jgi:uncharacterized protein (TIGR03437 family)